MFAPPSWLSSTRQRRVAAHQKHHAARRARETAEHQARPAAGAVIVDAAIGEAGDLGDARNRGRHSLAARDHGAQRVTDRRRIRGGDGETPSSLDGFPNGFDGEVFVNCRYRYDIQCQVVGKEGIASLPEPEAVPLGRDATLSTAIMQDWKLRFLDSYDVELQEWIGSAKAGNVNGPNAWDGYFAAVTADPCLEAKRTGDVTPIVTSPRPAFYA